MLLKTFNSVNRETVTNYVVFRGKDAKNKEYYGDFCVDYLKASTPEGSKNLLRLMNYEERKAKVLHVSVNCVTNMLDVTILISA